MSQVTANEIEELRQVTYLLEKLVGCRYLTPLTPSQQERYGHLCTREQQLKYRISDTANG